MTGSNVCEVGVAVDARTGTAVVAGAVDNLVKGAAGQAVQNMNLMLGLDQATALPSIGLYPCASTHMCLRGTCSTPATLAPNPVLAAGILNP